MAIIYVTNKEYRADLKVYEEKHEYRADTVSYTHLTLPTTSRV